ncbi:MAG: hypothetical protein K2I26_00475, partial [Paramuribaculum sp.]|nr:hypothetical protein [Paramuribaculum sp.]
MSKNNILTQRLFQLTTPARKADFDKLSKIANFASCPFLSLSAAEGLRESLNLNRVNSNTHERQNLQNNPEVFFG